MATRLDRWKAITTKEWILLATCCCLLPLADVMVRTLGLSRMFRILGPTLGRPENILDFVSTSEMDQARRMAWIVSAAARHGLYRANCLRQSLVLWWLLRRCGQPAQICIGSSLSKSVLLAHAWVILDKEVLNDAPDVGLRYPLLPWTSVADT